MARVRLGSARRRRSRRGRAVVAAHPRSRRRHANVAGLRDRTHRQGQGHRLHGARAGLAPGLSSSGRRSARNRSTPGRGGSEMNAPLSAESWHYRQLNARAPGLSYLSNALIELVREGHPVVAATADLSYSNGLVRFAAAHPERFIQFGISEQNMVSAAAGLATTGLAPYVATFASFLALLCAEQIRTDVAYCALPIRLIGHHSGIALGFYGTSHHATEDLAIMRSIANLTVVAPADGPQLAAAIKESARWPGPIYFRIGRGQEPVLYPDDTSFAFGKAIAHHEGS